MIVLSWSVRGLNSGPRQNVVHELIRRQCLDVIFLQETKLSIKKMQGLTPKLWRNGESQSIGAHGASGGLVCLWNPKRLQPLWWISSRSSMSIMATSLEKGEVILFSNFYAPTDFQGKQGLWSHIRLVCSMMPFYPWIMAGDFNAICELDEKSGGIEGWSPLHYCLEIT